MSGATMSWNLTPPKSYILHLGKNHLLMAWVTTWKRETIGPTSRLQKFNDSFISFCHSFPNFNSRFFPIFDQTWMAQSSSLRQGLLHSANVFWWESGLKPAHDLASGVSPQVQQESGEGWVSMPIRGPLQALPLLPSIAPWPLMVPIQRDNIGVLSCLKVYIKSITGLWANSAICIT